MKNSTVLRLLLRLLVELESLVLQGIVIFAVALIAVCLAFPILDWGIGSALNDLAPRR